MSNESVSAGDLQPARTWLVTVEGFDGDYSPPEVRASFVLILNETQTPVDWILTGPTCWQRFSFVPSALIGFWEIGRIQAKLVDGSVLLNMEAAGAISDPFIPSDERPSAPSFDKDKPVIHFVLECMAAITDRPGSRLRQYKVDVFASTLSRAKEAYYEQTVMYEVAIEGVTDATLCTPSDIQARPNVVQGLRLNNGAFLLESTQNW